MIRDHRTTWPLLAALVAIATAIPLSACADRPPGPLPLDELRTGDIVFHQSRSAQSEAIRLATGSRYTHIGVVAIRSGRVEVLEAVQPVQLTPIEAWIARGVDGHVVVKRLADADERLSPKVLECMRDLASTWLGRDYDLAFEWSDDRLYCSELVAKLYARCAGVELGRMQTMRDLDLDHPLVQAKLHQRFGEHLPLDEPVISPESIFDDPKLVTVLSR